MPEAVPAEVATALAGDAVVGSWEAMHLLLTVDGIGVPDVCLLSRTELAVAGQGLRAAVASRKARANLARSGRATLVVWAEGPWYLAVQVVRTVEVDGLAGYELAVTRVLRDDIGIPLEPMRFHVEPWLPTAERWARNAAVFAQLEGPGAPGIL